MKKSLIATMLLMLFAATIVFGDTVLDPSAGFVNKLIAADTTAQGKRKDTVYVFKRGATYFADYRIENIGWVMTLKAEPGNGPLPIIRVWPDASGNVQQALYTRDDAYIYNLILDGMGPDLTTTLPDPLFKMNGQLIRADAPGKVLVFDGCILNNAAQVLLRSSSGNRKIELNNTIMVNAGQLSSNDPGNGRCFDFRDAVTDTLILRNSTFVNGIDRIIRHRDANKKNNFIRHIEIDHCTFVHWLGTFGMFMLGDVGKTFKMTNNLLYNPMMLGRDPKDPWRPVEFELPGEFDANGVPIQSMLNDEPNDTVNVKFEVHHNVIYTEPEVVQFLQSVNVGLAPFATQRILGKLDAGLGVPIVEAAVQLANIPKTPLDIVKWYYANGTYRGAITTAEVDLDRRSNEYWDLTFDCSYTSSNPAFIGSDRKPVGDTNWKSVITAVKVSNAIPEQFSMEQNYPNPFNPTTSINYAIEATGKVTLKVFDLTGREVATLVDQVQTAGSYRAELNAYDLPTGSYFYVLSKNNSRIVKKMTLIK